MSKDIYVNNILIQKQTVQNVRIPTSINVHNVNSIINQDILEIITQLAQTTSGSFDAHKELSEMRISRTRLANQSQVSDEVVKGMENSFLVSDQDKESMAKINSQTNLIQSGSTGGMRRVRSKQGSRLNLNFSKDNLLSTKSDEQTIQISFNTTVYKYE